MGDNDATTADRTSGKLISPSTLCHFVLKTTPESYPKMVEWYQTFLGARITHANQRITFMTYDHEHHRIGIYQAPDLKRPDPPKSSVGVAHVAFGFDTLADLATSYEQKKARGIMPVWCVNHGISTSLYYEDPDGTEVETQVDNFDSAEEGMAYIEGAKFSENPIGVDFDPGELVRRIRAGEDQQKLKERPNIGKRMLRTEKAGVQA